MPFFGHSKKKKDDSKGLVERKLCYAKDTPEPVFDLSGCDMTQVPSGIFSLIKVFHKESLLLQENALSNLSGGGNLADLSRLVLLDLSHNKFTQMPSDFSSMKSLQVLKAGHNRLKSLPPSFPPRLQVLSVPYNALQTLPHSLPTSLRELDLTHNAFKALPQSVASCTHLTSLTLDANHPDLHKSVPTDILSASKEPGKIRRFICDEHNIPYVEDGAGDQENGGSENHKSEPKVPSSDYSSLTATLKCYEEQREAKRKEMVMLEKQIANTKEDELKLRSDGAEQTKQLLSQLASDQAKIDREVRELHKKQEEDRSALVKSLVNLEEHSNDLITSLLAVTKKNRNVEGILESLSSEQVKLEEYQKLRREEVLTQMASEMESALGREEVRREQQALRDAIVKKAMENNHVSEDQVKKALTSKSASSSQLVASLLQDEATQKELLKTLVLQRDQQAMDIAQQMALVAAELAALTSAEVQQRELRVKVQKDALEEKREVLTQILATLMKQRAQREVEVMERLQEMQEQRREEERDFWLVQFQRLMDRKPDFVVEAEDQVDWVVRNILQQAKASDKLDLLLRYRVKTLKDFLALTDKRLNEIGFRDASERRAILKAMDEYREEENRAQKKVDELTSVVPNAPPPEEVVPSAPPIEPEDKKPQAPLATGAESLAPSAPPLESVVTARVEGECVVCMAKKCAVVFLPCGHVCTCGGCSAELSSCPLCRGAISNRILLCED